MSPRSRHAPHSADSHLHKGSRKSVPRHQEIPGYSSTSFSSACPDANMIDSCFSLSSSTSGSRHRPETSQWSVSSGSPPQPDDFLSVGYNAMNVTESYGSVPMMTSASMDSAYNYVVTDVLPRHAPSDTMDQAEGLSQEFVMSDFLSGMDYAPCRTAMDVTSMLPVESWPNTYRAPPSPPPEHYVEHALGQGRHAPLPQDTIGCEPLGVSKIQPYSISRHSATQHRPLRPSSDRTDSQNSHRHAASPQSPPSPKDESADRAKARTDPLYDVKPDKNAYFHCPLVNEFKCSHKPTKQKCIYAKYLDSHLRPYKCRYATSGDDCEDTRFSSNACLFRHEREAHGKHGHGESPFLCLFENCDRAKAGNGFPRQWNQRDHMKRVHLWKPESEQTEQSSGRHSGEPRRRKASGAPSSVQMKRSESSYYGRAPVAPYVRDSRRAVTTSRNQAQVTYANPMQTGNLMTYSMATDDIQFSQYQMPMESRHAQSFFPGYSQAVY